MPEIGEDISKALTALKNGGIILYPTDTIWGIGCDATNEKAVSRIYSIKKREDSKSMLVLLNNENLLPSYVDVVPELAWELIEVSDRPLTIIYPGAKNLAPNLIAKDRSIGIRIVKDEFCELLLQKFRKPIVSSSANFSGKSSPENFSMIDPELINEVDYVVSWRQDDLIKASHSSIIQLEVNGEIKVLR